MTPPRLKKFVKKLWKTHWEEIDFPEWVDVKKFKKDWKSRIQKRVEESLKDRSDLFLDLDSTDLCFVVSDQVELESGDGLDCGKCDYEYLHVRIPDDVFDEYEASK